VRLGMPTTVVVTLAVALLPTTLAGQSSGRPKLHVNPRWEECSFQLDPALTRAAWHQFTEEAGLVVSFRPLSDARPMGRGHFEVSLLQWGAGIDDSDAAWNDTFVHPDSTHWLFEGDRLQFPGFMLRAGIGDQTDFGLYVTKNLRANYGFYGAQLQRSLIGIPTSDWAAAARVSFVAMYGPDDLDFTLYGIDLLASRTTTFSRWAVSPYAGVSTYLARSHEKSAVLSLDDESVAGAQGVVGVAVQVSGLRLAAEYGVAQVNSLSFKVGFGR
jgi:hypothetical protein